jgi:hypothetical protein
MLIIAAIAALRSAYAAKPGRHDRLYDPVEIIDGAARVFRVGGYMFCERLLHPSARLKKLTINKPFECRSAVVLSPPFGQCLRATYACSAGPPSMRAKGKTAGEELEEAWRP